MFFEERDAIACAAASTLVLCLLHRIAYLFTCWLSRMRPKVFLSHVFTPLSQPHAPVKKSKPCIGLLGSLILLRLSSLKSVERKDAAL